MAGGIPALLLAGAITVQAGAAVAADGSGDALAAAQAAAVHGQATLVWQANAAFRSPYQGPNSLDAHAQGRETFDATLYAGVRPWPGAELWIDPEIDQGFGLSDTLGAAGYPSGEAYKVGRSAPYLKLQRLFLRQTFGLGGARQEVEPGLNQLGGGQPADRLVLTIGKISVADIFDGNAYAHDPRRDFLNWALIDAGSFDYAANAWGYSYGAAAELYVGRWTLRAGVFDLSDTPNSTRLDPRFAQRQVDGEIEERHALAGRPGVVRLTAFLNDARMGRFEDALRLAQATGAPADIAAVRRRRTRAGVSLDAEQQLARDIGIFLRAGMADGQVEPYDFTDVDRTVSGGVSLQGRSWGRAQDVLALGGALNRISSIHQAYLDAGGLGILIGDGRLPHPGPEEILEARYDLAVSQPLRLSFDYQLIGRPGYNRDRGPVSIGAVRLHAEF